VVHVERVDLPSQSGPHPHLVAIAGKGGTIYLIDCVHMGHYLPNDDSLAVQTIASSGGGIFGSMAYWNHNFYVLSNSSNDALRQFFVHEGKLTLKAASGSHFPATAATPSISANGARDGVLWVLRANDDRNAVLYAFDAVDISRLLYDSEQNPSRDRAGLGLHFNIPTITKGHVYVGAKREVDVYGLLNRKTVGRSTGGGDGAYYSQCFYAAVAALRRQSSGVSYPRSLRVRLRPRGNRRRGKS